MRINIGNNNNIKNSTIGSNNSADKSVKENNALKITLEIIIGILIALISSYIVYKLGWNK